MISWTYPFCLGHKQGRVCCKQAEKLFRYEYIGLHRCLHYVGNYVISIPIICIKINFVALTLWAPSITNMLWHSFSSSIGNNCLFYKSYKTWKFVDNPVMLKEKIYSILHHMTNTHVFEENCQHKKCEHLPLSVDEERSRPWLSTNSKVGQVWYLKWFWKFYYLGNQES